VTGKNNLNEKKILFIEPMKSVKKRGQGIINLMLVGPISLIISGIFVFIYFFLNTPEGEDPFCALYTTVPVGIFALLVFYFLEYKKIRRFVIYEDGFTKGYQLKQGYEDNYIFFSDVKYYRVDRYVSKRQPPVIHVYYNYNGGKNRTWMGGWSYKKMEQVEQIFKDKGIPKGKRKWYE
jgi:hypothetical protein